MFTVFPTPNLVKPENQKESKVLTDVIATPLLIYNPSRLINRLNIKTPIEKWNNNNKGKIVFY